HFTGMLGKHCFDRLFYFPASTCADGTVHNLNEYIEVSPADAARSIGVDLIDEVFTQKLGVLVSENQLEEFFSLV
ncbi:unnamed protein product, partial [Ilex paraguariensis]